MNRAFLLFTVLLVIVNNGISQFEYEYARMYIYNVDNRLYGDYAPVKDGVLDKSIVGQGTNVSSEDAKQILDVFSKKADGLLLGLSACFVPHHAIVYFSEENKPVGWVSVCFGCDAARTSFSEYNRKKQLSKKDIRHAEQKLKNLSKKVKTYNFPILNDINGYKPHVDSLTVACQKTKCTELKLDSIPKSLIEGVTSEDFKKMWKESGVEWTVNEEYNLGGERFDFLMCKLGNSELYFSKRGDFYELDQGTVYSPELPLGSNLKVGASVDGFLNEYFPKESLLYTPLYRLVIRSENGLEINIMTRAGFVKNIYLQN